MTTKNYKLYLLESNGKEDETRTNLEDCRWYTRTSTWLPEESGKSSSDQSWTAGYGRDARLGLFSDSQEWLRRVSLPWNPPLDEKWEWRGGEAAAPATVSDLEAQAPTILPLMFKTGTDGR